MNTNTQKQTESKSAKTWQSTQYANIVRHVPSGTFYARFRIKGKLIWRSLKTDAISIAKARLPDMEKPERQRAEAGHVETKGKVLVRDCVDAYRASGFRPAKPKTEKESKPLKPLALAYCEHRIIALVKSWPTLMGTEVRQVSEPACSKWAKQARESMAPSVFNHTLGMLRNIFEYGIYAGARYNNPVASIKRASETTKKLTLPAAEQFNAFIQVIETGGGGTSRACADLVRFLAYGGFRKTEAANVKWEDCDFERNTITVRGDPATGLKNKAVGQVRIIPMIPDMRTLLERLREAREEEPDTNHVMKVRECQKAIDRAAKTIGMERITHHDLRHLFATRCIESGVDIPTVSRWLGHSDGGALAMRVYGHLRDEHSVSMAQRVTFAAPAKAENIIPIGKAGAA